MQGFYTVNARNYRQRLFRPNAGELLRLSAEIYSVRVLEKASEGLYSDRILALKS
jgi:hypothetical protein